MHRHDFGESDRVMSSASSRRTMMASALVPQLIYVKVGEAGAYECYDFEQ
jgi:hypothetical protein